MTTPVPPGTADETVAQVRLREAAHSHDLAERGNLRRLWRPPLRPGEWRTLGLFAADGPAELERVLASMPLRVWRSEDVRELAPHPNDPAPDAGATAEGKTGMEFLVPFVPAVPAGTAGGVAEATVR